MKKKSSFIFERFKIFFLCGWWWLFFLVMRWDDKRKGSRRKWQNAERWGKGGRRGRRKEKDKNEKEGGDRKKSFFKRRKVSLTSFSLSPSLPFSSSSFFPLFFASISPGPRKKSKRELKNARVLLHVLIKRNVTWDPGS